MTAADGQLSWQATLASQPSIPGNPDQATRATSTQLGNQHMVDKLRQQERLHLCPWMVVRHERDSGSRQKTTSHSLGQLYHPPVSPLAKAPTLPLIRVPLP